MRTFNLFYLFYTTPNPKKPTFLNEINSSLDLKEFTDFN